jgi:hypothetical protein
VSEYNDDLDPLFTIINIQYEFKIIPFINKQFAQYSDQILVNPSAKKELEIFLKTIVENIVKILLSQTYIKKLYSRYFSEEGLNLLVFFLIFEKATEYLKEKNIK